MKAWTKRLPLFLLLLCGAAAGCSDTTDSPDGDDPNRPDGGPPSREPECDKKIDPAAFNVDVPAVRLDGRITVNGAQPKSQSGTVSLRNRDNGDALVLGRTGDMVYTSKMIVPGTYDVYYGWNGSDAMADVPRNAAVRLREGLRISQSGSLDIDIPAVKLSGHITVGGKQPMAQSGSVSLRSGDDSLFLGKTGDMVYATKLVVPGTYDLYYSWNSSDSMPDVPRNTAARLRLGVMVTQDGALDVDIPAVQLSGHITVGGKQPVSQSGSVSLRNGSDSLFLGRTGDAAYSTKLVIPGTYDIYYGWNSSDSMPDVPRNTAAKLRGGVVVMSSGALDVDIPAVKLDGRITVNGAQPMAQSGTVSLRGGGDLITLGKTGDAAYASKLVVPGTYDIYYGWNSSDSMPDVPRNTAARLREGVMVTQGGSLDVDIPAVKLDGHVTVGGKQPMAQSGVITLRSGGDSLSLGKTGDPMYLTKLLLPGTYDIYYGWNGSDSMPDVPRNTAARLQSGVAVKDSGALDVNVPAVLLSGRITVGGQVPMSRSGAVFLRNLRTGDSMRLGSTSDANYASKLIVPAAYEVYYAWDGSESNPDVPRNGQTLLDCVVVPAP